MQPETHSLDERFRVIYRLVGDEAMARAKAEDICLEQTVELPEDLVPAGMIRDHVIGRIERFESIGLARYQATISFSVETAGRDLLQFLNVVFGNISIKPGIRVERLELPEHFLKSFRGPRFGRAGLRELLCAPDRPLLCTALKPMGFSAKELAHLAFEFALGGIDLIKDDHGLANQTFAPFRDRVEQCSQAVERANRQTGYRCIYVPNVTGAYEEIVENAKSAKQCGAGGLLVEPGLTGLDAIRRLADDDQIALPIVSHPSFQGSFVIHQDSGISHYALFGQIARLAGADATVFPNYGGRFSFSREECQSIARGAAEPMGHLKPIFPAPGGGMNLARVPEMLETYGAEVMLLIGGDLYRHGSDLAVSCRHFRQMIEHQVEKHSGDADE